MASSCCVVCLCVILLEVILVLGNAVAQEEPDTDPCRQDNHKEVDEPKRSAGFVTTLPEKPACDLGLEEGWYRFTSQAGGQMPNTCQGKNRCGTTVPLWMKGEHPSVTEGEVTRQVCGNFYSSDKSCCDETFDIRVKNCGNFFVYYLWPTLSCPVAYCIGTLSPCPVGKWSPSGFPPCKFAYPVLENPPTLEGPNIFGKGFDFQCEFSYDQNDPDQRFEVVWTFDGEMDEDIPPEILSDPSRVARLDGAKLRDHFNSKIECKVRSFYTQNTDVRSQYRQSQPYYAGMHIHPAVLVVSEEDFSKTVEVTSTIPIICTDGRASCCLTFRLDVDTRQVSVANQCHYSMCTKDWDITTKSVSLKVPVVANQDLVRDGDKNILMTFEKLLPAAGGPYLDIFAQHMVDQLPVVVEDQDTSSCSITGDPHINGFDNKPYHLYKLGDFTAYEVPSRHFEIQIRTWACAGGVTCNCGVVIREKNDIIRIDMCDQVNTYRRGSPIVSTVRKVRESTVIQRSRDGQQTAVYLPSGIEVKAEVTNGKYLQLYIIGPGTDKGKARGICGTNDGNRHNDFTHPDGTVDRICRGDHCKPNRFFEAWRVPRHKSLFEVVPEIVDDKAEVVYCGCNNKEKVVNCSPKENIKAAKHLCRNCVDVEAPVMDFPPAARRKREVVYEDSDTFDAPDMTNTDANSSFTETDFEKQWPNDQGMTEAEAREVCSKAMKSSQLSSACGEMNDMAETSMSDCLSDILYSGTTDFLDSITSVFTSECQLDLAKDPANYVTNAEGVEIMKPEYVDDICDAACEEHGHCGYNGTCICDDGWEGMNCHMLSGKGPQLEKIRSGPLCDKSQRPCKRIYLDVSNINLSNELICRVQRTDEKGNISGTHEDTRAIFISAYRIACDLPELGMDVYSQRFTITASNDGSLFSNEVEVRVFDSTCMDCNEDGCTQILDSCIKSSSSTPAIQVLAIALIFLALLSLLMFLV